MRHWPALALLLVSCATPRVRAPVQACGEERWPVKTLADDRAGDVDLTHVQDATVEALTALPAPRWHDDLERSGPELTTWRVRGVVTWVRREEDGDLHIVLRGDSGQTMIVESPSPACVTGSVAAEQLRRARAQVEQVLGGWLGERRGWVGIEPPQAVVVMGVGFFDKRHGQRGVAPNGIELHPVISIVREPDAS